jgi:hypothetical protein
MATPEISRTSFGFEIITETAVHLGWLKRVVDDDLTVLAISNSSICWLSDSITGVHHLSTNDIMTVDHSRIIVLEGTEERLIHATIGWLDRFNWSKSSWKKQAESVEIPSTHQLPTDRSVQDDWGDNDGTATSNRKPTPKGPSPLHHQANIPLD